MLPEIVFYKMMKRLFSFVQLEYGGSRIEVREIFHHVQDTKNTEALFQNIGIGFPPHFSFLWNRRKVSSPRISIRCTTNGSFTGRRLMRLPMRKARRIPFSFN